MTDQAIRVSIHLPGGDYIQLADWWQLSNNLEQARISPSPRVFT